MKARDVMTTSVISVGGHATIEEATDLMLKNRISALPVVDADGTLIGLISEGDLIRRLREGGGARRSWWLDLLGGETESAEAFVKARSRRVADVMTRDVLTVEEDTEVSEIARLLERNRIKRVPVVRDRHVVGIVSRANLLHALALATPAAMPVPSDDDRTMRERVAEALRDVPGVRADLVNFTVESGRVTLWGIVHNQAAREALRVAAENVPGVVAVDSNLTYLPAAIWE